MRFFRGFVRRQDLNDETFHFVRTLVSLGVAILFDAKILYMRSFDNKDVHLVKNVGFPGCCDVVRRHYLMGNFDT